MTFNSTSQFDNSITPRIRLEGSKEDVEMLAKERAAGLWAATIIKDRDELREVLEMLGIKK